MPDLRDLICIAERLEANGFTRRAAAAWRKVATHPATPEAERERIWLCAENGTPYTPRPGGKTCRRPRATAEQRAQMVAMLAQGMTPYQVAKACGVSPGTVTRASVALCTGGHAHA